MNAQREATHFKNRVLDLLDIFLSKQPKNPLVIRLVLPLVDLVTNTGADERQLTDKAIGILRTRLGKAKEAPSDIDEEKTVTILEELHVRARKASSADVLATLSQCSLFLSKTLLQMGASSSVVNVYKQSFADFVTRKASRLNSAFLQDFVRRHNDAAWDLRDDLLSLTGEAVNAYRASQVFAFLQTLLGQLQIVSVFAYRIFTRELSF